MSIDIYLLPIPHLTHYTAAVVQGPDATLPTAQAGTGGSTCGASWPRVACTPAAPPDYVARAGVSHAWRPLWAARWATLSELPSPRAAPSSTVTAPHTQMSSHALQSRAHAHRTRARATRHRSYISPHPVVSTTPPTVAAHIMASHQQQHSSVVAPSLMAVQPSALRSVPKATPCKA
jgi:hypothetical protein